MADRVCVLRHGYHPGEGRIERQVAALRDRGLDVDVICLRRPGEPARETVEGVDVHRLPIDHRRQGIIRYLYEYLAFALLAAIQVTRLDARRRYSLVEVHTMPDFLVFAPVVVKRRGARVVLDMHEVMPELFATKFGARAGRFIAPLVRLAERRAIKFADAVITVSDPTLEVLVDRGAPKEKLTIVMNSPDERVFAQREPRPLDGRRPVILAHGTLLERSGFETLVAGFSHLRKRVPGALLRIVGEGEHGPALMRAVADAGVADAVQFVGRVPLTRIAAEIAAADIGVAPNDVDAFTALIVPTRLLEYVGVGVPAVTVRSPAVERYFDESAVGLYRSGDAADLAAVLQRVLEAGEEAEGRAANATAQLDAISWRRMRERYLGVVDDLLDQVTRR